MKTKTETLDTFSYRSFYSTTEKKMMVSWSYVDIFGAVKYGTANNVSDAENQAEKSGYRKRDIGACPECGSKVERSVCQGNCKNSLI